MEPISIICICIVGLTALIGIGIICGLQCLLEKGIIWYKGKWYRTEPEST